MAWCIGMVSESLKRWDSYSGKEPPTKTPTSFPTMVCFGIPAFSSASKVHSRRRRCWGSMEMASFSVRPKKGASKAARSTFKKLPPTGFRVPPLPWLGW